MNDVTEPPINISFKPFIAEWCIIQGVSFNVSLDIVALSHHLHYPVTTTVLRGTMSEAPFLLYQLRFTHSLHLRVSQDAQ